MTEVHEPVSPKQDVPVSLETEPTETRPRILSTCSVASEPTF
jgi:hypothetical protein